ncbi:MAG: Rieske 2Fe-2S domain-containing protein [Planctomycetota bacterium]
MSVSYTWVQWNRHKRRYDLLLAALIVLYLVGFAGVTTIIYTGQSAISPLIMLIRATGTLAITMLILILAIGPLARLFPSRFAPLLYNRRHFGVTTFFVALIHAALVLLWYGSFGVVDPITAMLTMNPRYGSFIGFPFEVFGIVALVVLFYLAATSHDFWLKNLSPRVWKALHMSVYVAYLSVVLHVALGAMQNERSPLYPSLLLSSAAGLAALHLLAGYREVRGDQAALPADEDWVDIAAVHEVPVDRAKVVKFVGCERVAIFRHGDKLSAVSNVCAHQAGPLGEGKVVDGCITCPWHGYQYRPDSGQSPPPYHEKIATYRIRVRGERIEIDPKPNPPGTPVEPALIGGELSG